MPPMFKTFSDAGKEEMKKETLLVPQQGHLTEKRPQSQMVTKGDVLDPAMTSESSEIDIVEIGSPFKEHGPIKTSSPVERNMAVEQHGCEKDRTVSPILFVCEEQDKVILPTQEPQCNGELAEMSDESDCGPNMFVLSKSKTSTITRKVETRQKNADPSVRQEPQRSTEEKESSCEDQQPEGKCNRGEKDMTSFLLKLREAGKAKPACHRKLLSPVKVPTPAPEPEDDFLILEDEAPLWFSIPRKTDPRQRQSKTSSTDEERSTDNGTKDSQAGKAEKRPGSGQAASASTEESQTVHQKTNKNRKAGVPATSTVKNNAVEEIEAGDFMEQDKQHVKKQRRSKVASKQGKAAESLKDGRVKSAKQTRKRLQEPATPEAPLPVEALQDQSQEPSSEEHGGAADVCLPGEQVEQNFCPATEVTKPEGGRKVTSNHPANKTRKQAKPSSVPGSSSEDSPVLGKRKRIRPKEWWLNCPSSTDQTEVMDNPPVLKSKPNLKTSKAADLGPGQLSPLHSENRGHSITPGDRIFDRIYQRTPNEKMPSAPAPSIPKSAAKDVKTRLSDRWKRAPGKWWQVGDIADDVESLSSQPERPNPKNRKTRKGAKTQSKRLKPLALGTPKDGNMASSPTPPGRAPVPPLKQNPAPKSTKDIFTTGTSAVANNEKNLRRMLLPLLKEHSAQSSKASECPTEDSLQDPAVNRIRLDKMNNTVVIMDAATEHKKRLCWPSNHEIPQDGKRLSDSTLKGFKSGPSTMIELEHFEENEDMCLPSSRPVHSVLSPSELCGPPLKPLVLQHEDKAYLTEWFSVLWPVTVETDGGQITPDQFEWFSYRGKALGFQVDLQCDSFCNGKILLGSYTKKPLWVDHSAAAVFNVLTSCVSLTVNGRESRYNPGQSFMVPCGHAYSIHNLTDEPAVLYFNRMLAESPD
ncbi:uncharacterized protein ACJ7VT_016890 [Polymixia lowei]